MKNYFESRPTYLDNVFRQSFRNLCWPEITLNIDVDRWVKYCKDAGAQITIMDVKSQCYAYYDTKLMPKDPGLGKRDLVAELAAAAQKHGLLWGADVSPSHLESLVHKHPDWQQITADGSPEAKKWGFWHTVFCYNSPYRQHFIATLHEIAARYRPHGFYIDGIFWGFSACFCPYCEAKFQNEFSRRLPRRPNWKKRSWYDYLDWRYRQVAELSHDIGEAIHSVDPKIGIIWNCGFMGTGWYAAQSPAQARALDYASTELVPDWVPQGRNDFSFADEIAIGTTLNRAIKDGKPCNWYIYLPPEILLAETETSVDTAVATTTQVCVQEHSQHLRKVFGRVKQAEPYMIDVVSAADVAFHFSALAHNAYYRPDNHGVDKPFFNEIRGLYRGLLHNQVLTDALQDESLGTADLSGFRAVWLPNSVCLSLDVVKNLTRYLDEGGTVIATLETGLRDRYGNRTGTELLWPGSGLRFVDDIQTSARWFVKKTKTSIEQNPDIVAVPDQFLVFPSNPREWIGEDIRLPGRPDGFQVREIGQLRDVPSSRHLPVYAVEVAASKDWKTVLPLRFRRSIEKGYQNCPAVVTRAWGKGRIWYVNFQVGTLMTEHEHPWWRFFIQKLLNTAAGPSSVQVDAPVCVKAFLWRQPAKRRFVLHLVNELSSIGTRKVHLEDHIPVPCRVRVALPGVTNVRKVVGSSSCSIRRTERRWMVDFPALLDRAIVVCDAK